MVRTRAEKVRRVAQEIPPTSINGPDSGEVLVVGWGGTYGAITAAVEEAQMEGKAVASIHIRHLNPLPPDLGQILRQYRRVLVPEINSGQLVRVLRAEYLVDAVGFNRVRGMRAAAEGRIGLTPTIARHLDLCLGCRGCESACPSGVPFGQLLEATRGQLVRKGVRAPETDHATTRWALETFPHPSRLAPLLWGLRLYQASGIQTFVRASGLLAPFRKLKAMESLLPAVASAGTLPEFIPARGKTRGRAGLLTGCVQRLFFADVNARSARLLSAAGWDVVVPRAQGCCGALHLHAGRLDEFRGFASGLMASFPADVDVIVTNAAGCGSAIKEYGHWLPGEAGEGFAAKARDITEVLVDAELTLGELRATVAYHVGVRVFPKLIEMS